MKNFKLHVYNVKQGLCTMLEGVKDNGKKFIGIFDCGTSNMKKKEKEQVIDSIMDDIKESQCIDSIVISHQDYDHWSMLWELLSKYFKLDSKPIVCQNAFCLEREKDKVYFYEKTGERIIETIQISLYSNSFRFSKIEAGNKGDTVRFEFYAQYGGEEGFGEYSFKVSVDNICKKVQYQIWIDKMEQDNDWENDTYQHVYSWDMEDKILCTNEGTFFGNKIEKKNIYEQLDDKIKNPCLECCYYDFWDSLEREQVNYNELVKKLSQSTNINREKCIKKVWMGGDEWEKGYSNLYHSLKKLVKIGLVKSLNGCSMHREEDTNRICGLICADEETIHSDSSIGGTVSLAQKLIDLGTLTSIGKNIKKNASSLVVKFEVTNDKQIIFPGDATWHTFSNLKSLLNEHEQKKCSNTFLIAPHHGAEKTNYKWLKHNQNREAGQPSPPDMDNEEPFLKLLDHLTLGKSKPLKGCAISAFSKRYKHPARRFVNDMKEYVDSLEISDKNNIFYFDENGREHCEDTDKNIYCTHFKDVEKVVWSSESTAEQTMAVQHTGDLTSRKKMLPPKSAFV